MNILLTGANGFIGRNLKAHLQNKYTLLMPRSFELNLTDKKAVKKYFEYNRVDFIIHCANVGGAREIADKNTTIEENLAMVDNLLKYKKSSTRIIIFGSGAAYDKSKNLHKVKENQIGESIPKDLYGKSKLLLAQKIKDMSDGNALMLNIFGCYGYGEKDNRFPSYAINQALKGYDIVINQNVIFDYLFVEDMTKIFEYFIANVPKDNIINITPTISCSLLDIARIVKDLSSNSDKIRITILNPQMNNEYTGDNTLLLQNYPNIKFTSLQDGLKKFYQYLANRIGNFKLYFIAIIVNFYIFIFKGLELNQIVLDDIYI